MCVHTRNPVKCTICSNSSIHHPILKHQLHCFHILYTYLNTEVSPFTIKQGYLFCLYYTNQMKNDGRFCCAIMSPVMVDNLFKKMSNFLQPKKVFVQCFDSFGEGCKLGCHPCRGRLREILICHATINKTSLVETVCKIFISRDSQIRFLASVDIAKLLKCIVI